MIYVSIRHLFSNACTFLAFRWWWHLHQFWYLRKLHHVGLTFQGILLCLLQLMYYICRLIELTIGIDWLDFMFWYCMILSQFLLMSINSLLQLRQLDCVESVQDFPSNLWWSTYWSSIHGINDCLGSRLNRFSYSLWVGVTILNVFISLLCPKFGYCLLYLIYYFIAKSFCFAYKHFLKAFHELRLFRFTYSIDDLNLNGDLRNLLKLL